MTATATWLLILFCIGAIAAGLLAERRHRLLSRKLDDCQNALVSLTNAVLDSGSSCDLTRRVEIALENAREVLGG